MPEVNLSRIHSLIKIHSGALRELRQELADSRKVFDFEIFAATTDADLREFQEKIAKKKAKSDEALARCLKTQAYIAYLKKIAEDANIRFGIGAKLLKAGFIQREIEILEEFCSVAGDSAAEFPAIIKNTDYYKTSFTENNKIYILRLHMYDGADLDRTRARIAELKNSLASVNDEIASLNQARTVTILAFDEFNEKDFDAEQSPSKA
ncbi:MAG: hypothetical protein K2H64_02700 [Desulfovibrio sp.]|nr:hypothetical protein [Desulfovibrio sp.]